jgi:hypothetical protein
MVIEDSLYGFLPSVHFDLTPKVFRSADLKNDKSRLPNSSSLEFGSLDFTIIPAIREISDSLKINRIGVVLVLSQHSQ